MSGQEHFLYIKNMVCPRCIQSVKEEAAKAGFLVKSVDLGILALYEKPDKKLLKLFKEAIESKGFELISKKRERIVAAIKTEVINMVHYGKKVPGNQNFSTYLSAMLEKDYSYLSSLFSSYEKTTIEKYIILQKTEKAKELLSYDELSLGEIADLLGYSNTQHLSAQFKKITGMSPSQYKKSSVKQRFSIDQLGKETRSQFPSSG